MKIQINLYLPKSKHGLGSVSVRVQIRKIQINLYLSKSKCQGERARLSDFICQLIEVLDNKRRDLQKIKDSNVLVSLWVKR